MCIKAIHRRVRYSHLALALLHAPALTHGPRTRCESQLAIVVTAGSNEDWHLPLSIAHFLRDNSRIFRFYGGNMVSHFFFRGGFMFIQRHWHLNDSFSLWRQRLIIILRESTPSHFVVTENSFKLLNIAYYQCKSYFCKCIYIIPSIISHLHLSEWE